MSDGIPLIQREWGQGRKLVMVLHKGDCIEMNCKGGTGRAIYVIRGISAKDIGIRRLEDARLDKEIKDQQESERRLFRIRSADELRQRKAVKVEISPIGEVAYLKNGV